MKKYFLLLLLPALFACKAIKTVKIFKQGEVVQKEFKVEIPFEYRLGLVILKVEIQGEKYDFIVDTGAPNVVSTELAAKLGIRPSVKQKTKDSQGGKEDLGFAEIPDLSIGGIHFTHTGTAIADLQQSKEIACLRIDGFIGSNLMKKAIWQFDYKKQIVTITNDKSKLDIPSEVQTITFRQLITGTPVIDISYDGIMDRNVTFDLGSNGNFISSEKILHEVKKGKETRSTYGYGNNNSGLFGQKEADTMKYGVIDEIKFGDVTLQKQLVSFSQKRSRTIGTDFLKNYKVIIDWTEEKILLIPVVKYDYARLKTFGISPRFNEDKLLVGFLFHQSSAEEQGIAVGDQIIEINQVNYRTISGEKWCAILNEAIFNSDKETISIKILDKQNQEREIVLKKTVILD